MISFGGRSLLSCFRGALRTVPGLAPSKSGREDPRNRTRGLAASNRQMHPHASSLPVPPRARPCGQRLILEDGSRFRGNFIRGRAQHSRRVCLPDGHGRVSRVVDGSVVPGPNLGTLSYPLIGNYGVPPTTSTPPSSIQNIHECMLAHTLPLQEG